MLHDFALHYIGPLPVVAYIGIITYTTFAIVAYIGYANRHGNRQIPFPWHIRIAVIAFVLATFHAMLALSIFVPF